MIAIYGATGFTGRLVAAELASRGAAFLLAGRDATKLEALASTLPARPGTRTAQLEDAAALAALCREARVVINCAGPFSRAGLAVVRAAVAEGAHYLDSTGEQRFMMQVREATEGARGAVISGAAFEYAVSDLHLPLSTRGLSAVESIDVAYASSGFGTSPGTRLSIFEVVREGRWVYEEGRFIDRGLAVEARRIDLGRGRATRVTSFPGGEILHAPISVPGVRSVRTWMAGLPPPLLYHGAALVTRLAPVSWLARRALTRGGAPTPEARARARFTIVQEVRGVIDGRAATRRLLIHGADAYGLTAKLLAEMAERLARGEAKRGGFTSPAATFETESFHAALERWGVRCSLEEPVS